MIKCPDEQIGFEQDFSETSIKPVKRGGENCARAGLGDGGARRGAH
jgi:hypothetical protein